MFPLTFMGYILLAKRFKDILISNNITAVLCSGTIQRELTSVSALVDIFQVRSSTSRVLSFNSYLIP
jgi:hypothetical protein